MPSAQDEADLFINGHPVGQVRVKHSDAAWCYGEFSPAPGFAPFAALFGTWFLLMHADESEPVLSEAASEELRDAEMAIDTLNVELRWKKEGAITPITQINIDGNLIEWVSNV